MMKWSHIGIIAATLVLSAPAFTEVKVIHGLADAHFNIPLEGGAGAVGAETAGDFALKGAMPTFKLLYHPE